MQVVLQAENSNLLNVEKEWSVKTLKEYISENFNVEVADQILTCNGRNLEREEATLEQCGVSALSVVTLCSKLLGGKVHGSLTRAGKVKNQTKKVEKMEKAKPKTGRCKRRLQYKRRYHAMASLKPNQRPKGPNSNQK